jgi:hypothetical protein
LRIRTKSTSSLTATRSFRERGVHSIRSCSSYSGRVAGGLLRPSVRLVLKRNAFHVRSVTSKFALRVLSCVHGEHTKRDS